MLRAGASTVKQRSPVGHTLFFLVIARLDCADNANRRPPIRANPWDPWEADCSGAACGSAAPRDVRIRGVHDWNLAWLRVPIRHCDSAGQQSAWRDDEATEAAGRQLDIQPAFAVPAAARLVTGRAEPELLRMLAGSPRHARRVPRDDRRSANTPGQARFQSHTQRGRLNRNDVVRCRVAAVSTGSRPRACRGARRRAVAFSDHGSGPPSKHAHHSSWRALRQPSLKLRLGRPSAPSIRYTDRCCGGHGGPPSTLAQLSPWRAPARQQPHRSDPPLPTRSPGLLRRIS